MSDKPITFLFDDLQRVAYSHPAMRIAAKVRAKLQRNRERGVSSGVRRGVYGSTQPGEIGSTRMLTTDRSQGA